MIHHLETMNEDFGQKLEQARTRQGISIRQASDVLKIRPDFLEAFEKEQGDFDMPDVYKRGFLKLYARYLKLNPEELVQDYITYQKSLNLRHEKENAKQREALRKIELDRASARNLKRDTKKAVKEEPQSVMPLDDEADLFQLSSEPEEESQSQPQNPFNQEHVRRRGSEDTEDGVFNAKSLYLKIGLIFGGTLAVFSVVAILISSLTGSKPASNELAGGGSSMRAELFNESLEASPALELEKLTLLGDEDVHVVVRQEADKERLFSGNIVKGKPVTITRKGPVKIHFSKGSKLTIQKGNGQKIRPGRDGVGWIEI